MKIGLAQCNKYSDTNGLIGDALLAGCDMVLFPELVPVVKTKDYGIIVGSGYQEQPLWGKPYNTYELVGDELLLKYRKQNMFPGYDDNRRPGKEMPYVIIDRKKIYVAICYDIRNPWTFKQMDNPDVIIIAADFPIERIEDWKRLLYQRSKEKNCHVMGINTTPNGHSMVVHRRYGIQAEAGTGECLLIGEFAI